MESSIIPMIAGLGWQELLIILVIAMLLFGGTRLAGIGRSSGRAIREFKEETRGLKEDEAKAAAQGKSTKDPADEPAEPRSLDAQADDAVDAEIVDRASAEKKPDDLR